MNPLLVKPVILLAAGAAALVIGFGSGWAINGWRMKANVAETKQAGAEFRADAANKALDQLAGRLDTMNTATTAAQLDVRTLAVKMDQVTKGLKNVQAAIPLPSGCAPDSGRLRNLREAVGAANAAVTGAPAR